MAADFCDLNPAESVHNSSRVGSGFLSERVDPMVAANKCLLRKVRRLAIKDELVAMRLRGRLVVLPVAMPVKTKGASES